MAGEGGDQALWLWSWSHARNAFGCETLQEMTGGRRQVSRQLTRDRLTLLDEVFTYRAIGGGALNLDHADKSRRLRLEMPPDQCHRQRRRVSRVNEPHIGTRRQFQTQRRIQISIGRGRPSPDRILHELTVRLLAKHAAADVGSRLRVQ